MQSWGVLALLHTFYWVNDVIYIENYVELFILVSQILKKIRFTIKVRKPQALYAKGSTYIKFNQTEVAKGSTLEWWDSWLTNNKPCFLFIMYMWMLIYKQIELEVCDDLIILFGTWYDIPKDWWKLEANVNHTAHSWK